MITKKFPEGSIVAVCCYEIKDTMAAILMAITIAIVQELWTMNVRRARIIRRTTFSFTHRPGRWTNSENIKCMVEMNAFNAFASFHIQCFVIARCNAFFSSLLLAIWLLPDTARNWEQPNKQTTKKTNQKNRQLEKVMVYRLRNCLEHRTRRCYDDRFDTDHLWRTIL